MRKRDLFLATMAGMMFATSAISQEMVTSSLVYPGGARPVVPIPPGEQGLQTVTAEPWLPISKKTPGLSGLTNNIILEGPAFDRDGNLLVVEVFGGRVMRISPNRKVSIIVPKNKLGSAAIAIHKDGRLFIAGVGDMKVGGSVFEVKADGSGQKTVISADNGYIPDDLVFDSQGGFYFTDFRGTSNDPVGSAFYMSPDMKTVTPVLSNLSIPNGVALSPDGKTLWIGETGRGLLHRVQLSGPSTIALQGTAVPYHFVGSIADSIRVDGDGNVYVGLMGAGRVLVLDPKGVPIGQILVPGRDRGKFLYTSSIAIKPGTNELYITASDIDGQESMIFRSGAFAKAPTLFSHK
jgi:lactonase